MESLQYAGQKGTPVAGAKHTISLTCISIRCSEADINNLLWRGCWMERGASIGRLGDNRHPIRIRHGLRLLHFYGDCTGMERSIGCNSRAKCHVLDMTYYVPVTADEKLYAVFCSVAPGCCRSAARAYLRSAGEGHKWLVAYESKAIVADLGV